MREWQLILANGDHATVIGLHYQTVEDVCELQGIWPHEVAEVDLSFLHLIVVLS